MFPMSSSCVFLQDALITAIAVLPELKELCLENMEMLEDYQVCGLIIGESGHPEEQNNGGAGFIDSVLAGLASSRSLKVLKLVSLHDKVTLTR